MSIPRLSHRPKRTLLRPESKKTGRKRAKLRPQALSRYRWVLLLFSVSVAILVGRALYLHLMHRDFLQAQGEARLLRTLPLPAHRGRLLDRRGEPLAVSTPVSSVWVTPAQFISARARWGELTALLEIPPAHLETLLQQRMEREFVYLKRHLPPPKAEQVRALHLPGVHLQREYRRYYPAGKITAHAVGFTNIDDIGQEALELAFNPVLQGVPGSRRVLQDQYGKVLADLEVLQLPRQGRDIRLSVERRISYLAYRELSAAVARHRARAGSLLAADTRSGEILALVNQPAYNPNNRETLRGSHYRNRAVTDVFEPGSTMKPFTIAAALESGKYRPDSSIDTSPGVVRVNRYAIRDPRNYGHLSLREVLVESSNVGAARIALSLEKEQLWQTLNAVGFGNPSGSAFPGEAAGSLPHYLDWQPSRHASVAFGYGLSTTLLQLAQAYLVLANDGILRPLRFTAVDPGEAPLPMPRVLEADTAGAVRDMLVSVVEAGTGTAAQIPRYHVAGKTGTVHKATRGGYAEDRYRALFIGMAPAESPRLLVAVLLDEPREGGHYGGQVAAPVFAEVMREALRLLNVAPG